MSKEKILEESYKNLIKYLDWNIECEKEIKEIISKAIDQTREETIREVEWEIENWEIVDGKSFTSDKIKDILNKLKQ